MDNNDFTTLGLAPAVLKLVERLNFKVPTPIQAQSIPVALTDQDLIGIAQTGTGKTLAYGLPIIQKLFRNQQTVALIIVPVRELALQVEEFFKNLGAPCQLKVACLIGGANMQRQIMQLKRQPQVIIATPGRLNDHLSRRTVRLHQVGTLVLDEADRMLDMGFAPQIKQILTQVPADRQTMLFSATMPEGIVKLANSYMRLPVRVEVAPAGSATANVSHEIFFVHRADKPALLADLVKRYEGTILLFSRTKFGAKKIAATLRNLGETAVEIHSDRSLSQRVSALKGFKQGAYRILVATDIAARGLDVTNIELVINYDLPEQLEDYVHRIGRTGRADKTGHAISLAMPEQYSEIKKIENLIKQTLPVSPLPPHLPTAQPIIPAARQSGRSGNKNKQRQNFSGGKFGPKKFTPRPIGERKFGERKHDDRKFGNRPTGDRKFTPRSNGKTFGSSKFKSTRDERPNNFKNNFAASKKYDGDREGRLFADDLSSYTPDRPTKNFGRPFKPTKRPTGGRRAGGRPFDRSQRKNFSSKKRAR